MGVEAEFPAFSEGRLGRPWLPAPLRRLWLVRRCVAVGFQGWGCRRHAPLPILAAWWPRITESCAWGTLSLQFHFSLDAVPFSQEVRHSL